MYHSILLVFVVLVLPGNECDGTTPDIKCMMFHCSKEATACFTDHDCRATLTCITGCDQNNQTCMFECLYSYENAIFDTFMRCASTEYNCIKLDPPNPPVVCHPPAQVVDTFSMKDLQGPWYIVKGLNPLFDCFDCQITTFIPVQNLNGTMKVNELFDVRTVDGTIKQRVVNETVKQTAKPGIFNYLSTQMGHDTVSEWRVLDYGKEGDYVYMYYCGHIAANYYYEGSIVYSRKPTLSQDAITSLQTKATSLGFDFSKYCTPKTAGCKKY